MSPELQVPGVGANPKFAVAAVQSQGFMPPATAGPAVDFGVSIQNLAVLPPITGEDRTAEMFCPNFQKISSGPVYIILTTSALALFSFHEPEGGGVSPSWLVM